MEMCEENNWIIQTVPWIFMIILMHITLITFTPFFKDAFDILFFFLQQFPDKAEN